MVNIAYLYKPDTNTVKERFNRYHFVDKKLGFQVIEHGTVLPHKGSIAGLQNKSGWGFGGIVDNEGKFIQGSHVHYGIGNGYTPPPRINSI